jgi:hypothetical protein
MKTLIGSLCILVLLAANCFAQETNSEAPAALASKEDVVRFMDLLHLRQTMGQLMDGMRQSARVGAEAGFKEEIPDATPEQLGKVDELADAIFAEMPIDEIIQAIIPIYQKHIAESDLKAIVAFYSSPVGQRLLKEQPAMMAEAMQAGQGIMLKKLPALEERLKATISQFANEELAKAANSKKPTAN